MASAFIDHSGIRTYERTEGRKASKLAGHILAEKASRILSSQVQHTEEPTVPIAAQNFRVEPTPQGHRVVNDDPVIVLLEFGYHPGGGQTFIGPYAPFRRALDEMEQ